ncbi:MAG TPA: GAF domain-containing protein, partial [Humisphaera sp.]
MPPDAPPDGLGVLLLAPTTRDGQASRALLASAGIPCRLCGGVAQLCAAASAADVAAIILPEELVLADGGDALAAALAGQPVWSDLPVIVLSRAGGAESPAVERAVATLGNVSVVERPVRVSTLLSVVRAALRARQRQYEVRDHLDRLGRAEARDRFLLALDDAVRPMTDPGEVTAAHARLLAEHLGADRCAYADVEPDEDTFNLTGNYNRPGVHSIVGRYRFAEFGAEVLRLMRADEPYVVPDIDAHPAAPRDLSAYRQTQIRAVVCVPLHKAGRFVAAMAVHQRVPRAWRADEVDLVR